MTTAAGPGAELRLTLILNPAAAGGRAPLALAAARDELDRLGVAARVVESEGLDHAKAEAERAAQAGERVVAVGGDGLVGALAGVLCDQDTALAIIPGGRGNDFARVLEIPREPAAAARIAVEGAERLLDVAAVNGRPFVGIASLGFDSDANRIANESRVPGKLVYLYAALRALAAWKPARFEVTVDGAGYTLDGYSVAVANSRAYGGGMMLMPHAELDDGLLDVLTVSGHSKLAYLRGLPKVFSGSHIPSPHVQLMKGEVVEVAADRPFTVYADGDPIAELPIRVTVRRRCLRVVAPAS